MYVYIITVRLTRQELTHFTYMLWIELLEFMVLLNIMQNLAKSFSATPFALRCTFLSLIETPYCVVYPQDIDCIDVLYMT